MEAHLTLKRAQEELEAQNEILKENARLREEVEAISRHDLKNPLMIVMSVPQVILAEASRRMADMINRTIDL